MNKNEIEKLESEFKIQLPSEYRKILHDYPLTFPLDELAADYNTLRKTNFECRTDIKWDFPWSNNLWWIGEDGFGNFTFINCNDDEAMVYNFDNENKASSFDDKQALAPMPLPEYINMLKESTL